MRGVVCFAVVALFARPGLAAMDLTHDANEQPVAVVAEADPAPGAAAALDRDSQPSDMGKVLRQAIEMLREQADALRAMHQEIELQGKEIESLRQERRVGPLGMFSPSSEESAAGAARLQSAVLALRSRDPAPLAQIPEPRPGSEATTPSELFFRIGSATFTPGGWVDFTTYYRSTNVGSGLGTNFQSIPYNNTVQGGQSEVRLTAQSSRFGFRVDEAVNKVKVYGYAEADFNGYQPGNAYVSTNGNSLRMRVYYLNLTTGKWEVLGGQGWSLLTPTRKALSPFLADLFNTFHIDTSYQVGLIYARQTQFRLVYHPTSYAALGLSVENPEQFSGSAVTFPTLFNNVETDINSSTGNGGATATPNKHPDVIAKGTFDKQVLGRSWHMGAAGLLTSTRIYTPASVTKGDAASDSREGGAFIGNVNLELVKNFRLISLGFWSDGGGRYMGGMGPGFVVLQQGSSTAPFNAALIHSGSGIGGFEWKASNHSTVSSYYSAAYFERRYALDPGLKTATYVGYGFPGSANSQNRSIQEVSFASTTTLWQNPTRGALQVITQSSYVTRAPWYIAPNAPKNAHTFMQFMNLRYVIP